MEIKKKYTEYISEKERIRAMEESCARLRERIAKEEEEKRQLEQQEWLSKQQEVKKQREAIRQKWNTIFAKDEEDKEKQRKEIARKLDERWQKKLEKKKEQEQAEYLKKVRNYCAQLEKELKSIDASLICINDFGYNICVTENVDVYKLIEILKGIIYISWNCIILDLKGDKLIEITDFDEEYCSLYFYQEEKEEIEFDKGNAIKQIERFIYCYLGNRKIERFEDSVSAIITNGINQISTLSIDDMKVFLDKEHTVEEKTWYLLESSNYDINFKKNISCSKDNDMLVVDYELPNISNISDIKEYKYIASKKEINIKKHTDSYISKRYENVLYSIVLRSLYEIFYVDTEHKIKGITFNGFVTQVNPATGITERKCVLSIQADRDKFSQINLSQVEPKACFKALKGVSAAKLIDFTPITPILTFNKKDRRFVEGKDIAVNQGTNLAAMHWEDFEHLVRELFEMEFAQNGGEVRVTQASRDGGVDAIVFDPDPLRGGKIVIQAKRYTNTVGVSAVRDLYGTVINEGANTGILITTSDYGHDSYDFAKDKPLKLLNGGHLLALLHKNGKKAHIDIDEAKKILTNNNE